METVNEAERLLPKVGDKMRKKPTLIHPRGLIQEAKTQDCEVVEVNRKGLRYRVRFENGAHECYKVPELPAGGAAR
jgi:hypothetical protein